MESPDNIPAGNLSKNLERIIRVYEWFVALAILFVVAGLIGEKWNRDPSSRMNAISTDVLLLGVCGEFVLHVLLMVASKRLVAVQRLELEQLGLEIAKANQSAAGANRQAGETKLEYEKLRQANLLLQGSLEIEKRKTSAILQRMAWRHLDKSKKPAMALELSRLRNPGLTINVVLFVANDVEALTYMRQVVGEMDLAELSPTWVFRPDWVTVIDFIPIGIFFLYAANDLKRHGDFIRGLFSALSVGAVGLTNMKQSEKFGDGTLTIGFGVNPSMVEEIDPRLFDSGDFGSPA